MTEHLPRAMIVDDEPLARHRLRDLVAQVPLVEIIGEAADGPAAVEAIDRLRPDLVFLDIAMPGLSGLQVLERVEHRPGVIFTTAFDRYAATAFELAAVDYLLKPFDADRFRQALERAIDRLGTGDVADASQRARDLLSRDSHAEGPLRRLFVREADHIVPLAVSDVERLEARDDYVAVHAHGVEHLIRTRLRDLERRLDPDHFTRVHRSHIVNMDRVRAFEAADDSRLIVVMADGSRITASRSRSTELRKRMSGL